MKNLIYVSMMAVAGMLLLPAFPSSVSGQQGITAAFHGKAVGARPFCMGDQCVGDLLTCSEGNLHGVSRQVLTYVRNVCDDAVPGSECAGKLTILAETCNDVSRDFVLTGTIFQSNILGKNRTCFDEDAASDCTDPLPENVVVVQEADTRVFVRSMALPYQQTPSGNTVRNQFQGNSEVSPTATTPFTINGKAVEFPSTVAVAQLTQQTDADLDDCEAINGSPGCGLAGVAMAAPQAPTAAACCADCDSNGEVKVNELVIGVGNALDGCPEQ